MIPAVSVVLATHEDGELLRANLDSLARQCAEVGGEVLLADGSREGLPHDTAVHLPGADVFTLRAAAAALATGAVIALTEDHCLVADDWVGSVLEAHTREPGAVAVGGSVANGSQRTAFDRANFLVTFAPFLAPLPARPQVRIGPVANVSFKRELLDADLIARPGHLELQMLPHLHRSGLLSADERIRATHVQSYGPARTVATHFHNGRATAGVVSRDRRSLRATLRAAGTQFALPARTYSLTLHEIALRGSRPDLRTRAAIAALSLSHGIGQLVGVLRGAGSSAAQLD